MNPNHKLLNPNQLSLHIVLFFMIWVVEGWEQCSHTVFWCRKTFPYIFAIVTVLEDVRSK